MISDIFQDGRASAAAWRQPACAAHHDGLCAARLQHVHLRQLALAHLPRAKAAALAGRVLQLLVRAVPAVLQGGLRETSRRLSHRLFSKKFPRQTEYFDFSSP